MYVLGKNDQASNFVPVKSVQLVPPLPIKSLFYKIWNISPSNLTPTS